MDFLGRIFIALSLVFFTCFAAEGQVTDVKTYPATAPIDFSERCRVWTERHGRFYALEIPSSNDFEPSFYIILGHDKKSAIVTADDILFLLQTNEPGTLITFRTCGGEHLYKCHIRMIRRRRVCEFIDESRCGTSLISEDELSHVRYLIEGRYVYPQ